MYRIACTRTRRTASERHLYLESSLGGFVVHEVAHETYTITNAVEASSVRSLK
jgi:hypothetical protein